MELIEAEKAKDVIHEYFKSLMVNDASGADVYKLAVGIVSYSEHDANLLKAIDELPSVEAPDINVGNMDIIHCKDCEWWKKQKDSIQGRCALHKMYPSGNWYCGTARRRGE